MESNNEPISSSAPSAESSPIVADAATTKKSKGLIATTIIAVILAIAGIVASAYFFMDSNNKTAEITNLKSKIDLLKLETGAEFIEKEENGTIITAVMLPDLDNTINDADTRFQSYSLNLLNNIKSSDEYFDREFVSSSNGTLIAEIDKSANLVLYYESGSYYPGYPHHTIATDVIDCEFVFVGNGGGPSLYFVDKDGHIGATEQLSIDLSNHAPEVTTNIVNLQNIVSISNYSNAAGNFVEYVDIDGNIKR